MRKTPPATERPPQTSTERSALLTNMPSLPSSPVALSPSNVVRPTPMNATTSDKAAAPPLSGFLAIPDATLSSATVDEKSAFTSYEDMEKYLRESIPFIDVTVSGKDLFADSKYVVERLFGWRDDELELDQCKDGITNKLIKAKWVPTPARSMCSRSISPSGSEIRHAAGMAVLIRTYGKNSELLIDRKTELMNMLGLSRLGLAPVIHGRFQNGFVYGYVPGEVFHVDDMAHPTKSLLVAQSLATWHKVQLPFDRQPKLFPTIRKWLKNVPETYSASKNQERFTQHFSKEKLVQEVDNLEKQLTALGSPVTLCHCDLLSANIIYRPTTHDVTFIDYEYGAYNYRGFDIANHFCEWAGITCEWRKCPDTPTMRSWLTEYWRTCKGAEPSESELAALTTEVIKFKLAAHFYWGLWALIQANLSDIDFDYMGYAILRFTEYWKQRDASFAL